MFPLQVKLRLPLSFSFLMIMFPLQVKLRLPFTFVILFSSDYFFSSAETASTFVIFVSSDYVSSEGVDNVDCITVAEQSTVLTDALYGVVQGKYDIPLCASQRQSQCMSVLVVILYTCSNNVILNI